MSIINTYNIRIYERYRSLLLSGNPLNNKTLWKIFEFYTCIKLSDEYKTPFYLNEDIDIDFKMDNGMSQSDTGIDACNLIDTIVQCKLRMAFLNWKECATFFGSQVILSKETKKPIVRWENMIISRNAECTLSFHLAERKELFIDKQYPMLEVIDYCNTLMKNPPKYPVFDEKFAIRKYQQEAIDLINSSGNVVINMPTGTGKNVIMMYSWKEDKKYLILVPYIVLMDQLYNEISKYRPEYRSKTQLIGDGNHKYDTLKDITICVYNSINIVETRKFDKIYVDEAHHIDLPAIYLENMEDSENKNDDSDDKDDSDDEYISKDDKEFSYIDKIRQLSKHNNNVYLSATIDEIDGFKYYKQDIRDMIEQGYLCDYTIHVPIFTLITL